MPYVGAKDPDYHDVLVDTVRDIDLTAITGVESVDGVSGKLSLTPPKGAVRAWPFTIAEQSATAIKLRHVFAADGSDVRAPGKWIVRGFLITANGRYRLLPSTINFERY